MPKTYSKYQQWVDAGKPYWQGVSLANAVPGHPALKRTLGSHKSPWNISKLNSFLFEHYSKVPAERLSAAEKADIAKQEAKADKAPKETAAQRKSAAVATKVSEVGPAKVDEYSETEFAAVPFQDLPDNLKKGRLAAMRKRDRAVLLHTRLGDGIEDDMERSDVVAEIVELMDAVNLQWDLERQWKFEGVLPELPEDTLATLRKLDLPRLELAIVNRFRPRVHSWKGRCKLRDGDKLVEAKLNLADAENTLALALQVLREKRKELGLEMDRLHKQIGLRRARIDAKTLATARDGAALSAHAGSAELGQGIRPARLLKLDKLRKAIAEDSNAGLMANEILLRRQLEQISDWIRTTDDDTTRLAARVSKEQKVVERTAYHRIQEAKYVMSKAGKRTSTSK